jgi:hypothetical protein
MVHKLSFFAQTQDFSSSEAIDAAAFIMELLSVMQ